MRPHFVHYACAGTATLLVGLFLGCGPAEHAKNEDECAKSPYNDTCKQCASEDRCAWCGGACHYAGDDDKKKAKPGACGDKETWVGTADECDSLPIVDKSGNPLTPPPPPTASASAP